MSWNQNSLIQLIFIIFSVILYDSELNVFGWWTKHDFLVNSFDF